MYPKSITMRTPTLSFLSLLLAATSNAHMHMAIPVPFNLIPLARENAPITAASQYPCNPTSETSFVMTSMNNIAVGSPQVLKIAGGAPHNGGSCQLSITTDKIPTASSSFKVIKSFIGGCPDPTTGKEFSFTLPDSVPNGQVTLAWSWLAAATGEFYMNCAPVTVTGGATDSSELSKLPDMFVASKNVPEAECTFQGDVVFPNPGKEVEENPTLAGGKASAVPVGAGCGKTFVGKGVGEPAPAASSGADAVVATTAAAGGIFAPGASSAAAVEPSTLTTLVAVTATPAIPEEPTGVVGTVTAPAAVGTGTSCPTDGAVVCNGTEQFGLCDHGKVVWQAVASGTKCQDGQVVKREFRPVHRGRILRPRFGHSHY